MRFNRRNILTLPFPLEVKGREVVNIAIDKAKLDWLAFNKSLLYQKSEVQIETPFNLSTHVVKMFDNAEFRVGILEKKLALVTVEVSVPKITRKGEKKAVNCWPNVA